MRTYWVAQRTPFSALWWQRRDMCIYSKKGWEPKNWCFRIVVLEKTLESPLNCKEIKPVNAKGNQPWILIGIFSHSNIYWRLRWQYFGHLMRRADSLEKMLMLGKTEGRRRRGQERMRWLGVISDSMYMSLSMSLTPGNSEGQGKLSCCSPWGRKEPGMT